MQLPVLNPFQVPLKLVSEPDSLLPSDFLFCEDDAFLLEDVLLPEGARFSEEGDGSVAGNGLVLLTYGSSCASGLSKNCVRLQ